jgi:hypothetical protein
MGEQATDNECFEVFKILEDETAITRSGSRRNPSVRLIRVD